MEGLISIIILAVIIKIALKSIPKPKRKKTDYFQKPNIDSKPYIKNKTTYQEKIQKGKDYEDYIARYYSLIDYTVIEHGKLLGRKDQSIDIIAEKENEILLIQCKNYNENHKWKIRQKDIKAFRMDCIDFIEKNKQYKKPYTKILFVTSKDILDQGAKMYIQEKKQEGKNIDYRVIEYS